MIARLLNDVTVAWISLSTVFLSGLVPHNTVNAGGGPETVLLVVNRQSEVSLTIANHYQALRQIPAENVFYLDWDPNEQITDIDRFREKILSPIFAEIMRRGPTARIDSIVYSADFPWGIELKKDIDRFVREHPDSLPKRPTEEDDAKQESSAGLWPKVLTPRGSITGLTYLAAGVLAKRPDYYMSLRANQYMRRAIPEQKNQPTLGFNSELRFGPHGDLAPQGERYWLSTMLGIVADEDTRGNMLEEIIEYLTRSALADGSFPKGTIYFVQNGDIRSRTRDSAYPEVVEVLQELGIRAQIVRGVMPEGKPDCQGVMMGTASFDWSKSGSTILPGAICDHLTSLGGVMTRNAGQTPLTEFLRYGAATASGTVTEPFAIAEKFPLPTIHLHYARGCSVAEAFYQSVYGPYQLLIVGDPLCRPWANIPRVSIQGVNFTRPLQGVIPMQAHADFLRPGLLAPLGVAKVDYFQWFVDAQFQGQTSPGETFTLDTQNLHEGYHELRVIAVEKSLVATRGACIQAISVSNQGGHIHATCRKDKIRYGERIELEISAPGAMALVARHNGEMVGRILGEKGIIAIATAKVGRGPIQLSVAAINRLLSHKNVISPPIYVTVD